MTLLTPEQKIDEIVGTFIALKYDDTTDEYSDGTLERWNNMKQAILSLLLEEKIKEMKLLMDRYVKISRGGTVRVIVPLIIANRLVELQALKPKEN